MINAAPTGTDVVLYKVDESDTDFVLKITVADANTLNDIETVVIELEEQDFATEKATFLWSAAEGWVGPEGRWSIKEAACKVPGDLTETSGDWWLYLSLGCVASQWKIKVTVTDSGSASGDCTTSADMSFANTVDEQRVYFDAFDALPFRDESGSIIYVSTIAVVENQYKDLPNASILIDVSSGASARNFTIFFGSLSRNLIVLPPIQIKYYCFYHYCTSSAYLAITSSSGCPSQVLSYWKTKLAFPLFNASNFNTFCNATVLASASITTGISDWPTG